MSDYNKTNIGSGYNTTTSVNTELGKIETAVNSKVDKSGSTMTGQLDMNSNKILNVADGTSLSDGVNYGQLINRSSYAAADAKFFDTVAAAQADSTLEVGDVVVIKERASAIFDVVTATTNNGFDIIDGTASSVSLQLRVEGSVNVKAFGAVGDGTTDDTLAIQAAITYCSTNNRVLQLEGVYAVSAITLTCSLQSLNCTIKRVSGYVGSADLITVTSSVNIVGSITFDGNNIQVNDADLCLVSADNVYIQKATVTNINSLLSNPTRGITVTGDYFEADTIVGDSGYTPLYLIPSKNINSFKVKTYDCKETQLKGFVINGGFDIEYVWFGSFRARSTSAEAASDGFLADSGEALTALRYKFIHIENMDISGFNSNCVKTENTESFTVGTVKWRIASGTVGSRNALDTKAKYFKADYVDCDWRVTLYSQTFDVDKLYFRDTCGGQNIIDLQDSVFSTTNHYNIQTLSCVDATVTSGFIRLSYSTGANLHLTVDNLVTPDQRIFFSSSLPANFYNGDSIIIGNLIGFSRTNFSGSTSRDNAIQYKGRVFYTESASAPVTGTYKDGDRVYFRFPSAGGFLGYIATADIADASIDNSAFKTFGAISV